MILAKLILESNNECESRAKCDPAGVVKQNTLDFLTYLNTSGVLYG